MAGYTVDPERQYPTEEVRETHGTGIFVRAQDPDGHWINADIVELDTVSLNAWLRSRGGENEWAEGVVRTLLGHN